MRHWNFLNDNRDKSKKQYGLFFFFFFSLVSLDSSIIRLFAYSHVCGRYFSRYEETYSQRLTVNKSRCFTWSGLQLITPSCPTSLTCIGDKFRILLINITVFSFDWLERPRNIINSCKNAKKKKNVNKEAFPLFEKKRKEKSSWCFHHQYFK